MIEFIRPKSRFGSIKRKLGEREAEIPTLQPKGNEALYLHRQVECQGKLTMKSFLSVNAMNSKEQA